MTMYNVVAGVDISKSTLDLCVVRWGTPRTAHDSFLNKPFGHKQAIEWLAGQLSEGDKVMFCLEHTGYYGHRFCLFLKQKGYGYAAVNPLQIKHSMGFRREKSDKADALSIARYGLRFQQELHFNTNLEGELLALQVLVNHRKHLQKQELALNNRHKVLSACLGGACTKGVLKDSLSLKSLIRKRRRRSEKEIEKLIAGCPPLKKTHELLQGVPGVGPVISWYTIVFTRNFGQITDARKFACYCCVAPFKNESGSSIRKATRVSFYGNRMMKSLLVFGALTATKYDPEIKAYYERQMKAKANHKLVLNAVMNKLIHRMFATVKRGTPYVKRPVH